MKRGAEGAVEIGLPRAAQPRQCRAPSERGRAGPGSANAAGDPHSAQRCLTRLSGALNFLCEEVVLEAIS